MQDAAGYGLGAYQTRPVAAFGDQGVDDEFGRVYAGALTAWSVPVRPGPCLIHEAVWADAQEDEYEPQKSPVAVVKVYAPPTPRPSA